MPKSIPNRGIIPSKMESEIPTSSLRLRLKHLLESIVSRNSLRASLKRHPYILPATVQLAFIALSGYWLKNTPPPGYAVASLGVAAVFMAIRGTEFVRVEKIVWVSVACCLFIVELHAIAKDRAEFAQAESRRHAEESLRFQSIANEISATDSANQDRFDATLKKMGSVAALSNQALGLSGTALRQITGGGRASSLQKILEFHLTRFPSATSIFLIDNFPRNVSAAFSSHSKILIADLWKIRNRGNSLKTNERSHF
jgi:hypothetical protein